MGGRGQLRRGLLKRIQQGPVFDFPSHRTSNVLSRRTSDDHCHNIRLSYNIVMDAYWIIAVFAFLPNFCSGNVAVPSNRVLDVILNSTDAPVSTPSRELEISELGFYVNTEEGKEILRKEFQSIEGGERKPWSEALKKENIDKNRYKDLLPYDETRVKLHIGYEDPISDYINANYIDGFNGPKEYIATQGPLQSTGRDFWAMVWQENATKIVMLANLTEHGEEKVHKYWPEAICTYGEITVTKLSEHPMPHINHVVRIFSLKKVGIHQPRIVRQFHYTGWPDLGVPEDRLSVVALMRQVRLYRAKSKVPIILHCSAGIGRTGTVILMDSMMERAKKEGRVNFPKRLDHMRLQRVDVVEKPEQYIFAHEAIYDAFNRTDAEDYLKNVERVHRSGDYETFTDEFKIPIEMEKVVQRLKWHNHKMSVLIHALEHGYEQSDS